MRSDRVLDAISKVLDGISKVLSAIAHPRVRDRIFA
jgi:hypothetical protein